MPRRIEEDRREYRKIIRGELHKELQRLIRTGQMLGRRDRKGRFIVPIPSIDMPDFRFGKPGSGVGRGEGKEGDVIGRDPQESQGDGEGEAGNEEGEHTLVAVDLDDVLDMMQEELNLPNIEPKENPKFTVDNFKYTGIKKNGPDSLRHIRRTMRQTMLRQIETGDYDEENPMIIPLPDDMRYKSWKVVKKPISNAVIFFARDYSGSINSERREIISDCCWWIDSWISRFYDKTERVYIGHDTAATILDRDKFYGYTSGGGTYISSAFELIQEQIDLIYDPNVWNVYIFYFSDMENWGDDDSKVIEIMNKNVDQISLYGIVSVLSYLTDWRTLIGEIRGNDKLSTSKKVRTYSLKDVEDKMEIIKSLLGKNKITAQSDSYDELEPDEYDR
jgi:uncharacterized sporulation protein YeaH/YhbH (DUF444 family)